MSSSSGPQPPLSRTAWWTQAIIIGIAWALFTWALADRITGGSWVFAILLQLAIFAFIHCL